MDKTLEYLIEKLQEERTLKEKAMVDGVLQSFEEYKHVTGVIRGLLLAESVVTDLANRMENSDE